MRNSSKYAIALTAAFGVFPVSLDSTIVNVATVPISQSLHASVDMVQWIVLGYLLATAAVTPLSGYLGNRFGSKRLFLLGLSAFTFFSLLCGVAANETWLIAFRALQGMGGGLLLSLGLALAMQPFAPAERGRATAVIGVPMLLAPVLGPIIGGLIIDGFGWQAIFFVNVPIGIVAGLLAWHVLPPDAAPVRSSRKHFDYLGLALSILGVSILIYGSKLVSQTNPESRTALHPDGTIYGWGYWLVWVLLGAGLALLAAFAVHALRSGDDPVLDLRLFKNRQFSISNIALWIGLSVSFGMSFLLPVYLQQLRLPHLSPLHTGLALLPLGLGSMVGIVSSGSLYGKLGPRLLTLVGAIGSGIGLWLLRDLNSATAIGNLWAPLLLLGLGGMLTMVPTQTLALATLSGPALNKGASLVNSVKLLIGAIGPAVLVTLWVQQTSWHAARTSLAGGISQQVRTQLAAQAGTDAMRDVFTILVFGAVLLAAVAFALPGRPAAAHAADTQAGKQSTVDSAVSA